jgi:hypothetical protein
MNHNNEAREHAIARCCKGRRYRWASFVGSTYVLE